MTIVNFGIAGCGRISGDFVNALKGLKKEEGSVVACAARSIDSAKSFAQTHGISNAYGAYSELCTDNNVHVIYVGTVNSTHHEIALEALHAGKHVLLEKPMAMNAKQVEEMFRVARENNRFIMEGMWTRFFPATRKVRELLENGTIGDIHHMNASFGVNMSPDNIRIWDPKLGGGGCLDLGVYTLAAVTMVFGYNPDHVHAVGTKSGSGVDAFGSITLQFGDKQFATVQYSCVDALPTALTITGSKGRIQVHEPFYCPSSFSLGTKAEDGTFKEETLTFDHVQPAANAFPFTKPHKGGFLYEAQAVHEAIVNKKLECEEHSHAESIALAKIMDSVRQQIGVVYDCD